MNVVDALRAVANWYEEHPGVPTPWVGQFDVFLETKEELAGLARLIGKAEKQVFGDWFCLVKRVGECEIHFNLPRNLACIRRVVGTTTEPETVTPARVVETVEWDCEPILADAGEVSA